MEAVNEERKTDQGLIWLQRYFTKQKWAPQIHYIMWFLKSYLVPQVEIQLFKQTHIISIVLWNWNIVQYKRDIHSQSLIGTCFWWIVTSWNAAQRYARNRCRTHVYLQFLIQKYKQQPLQPRSCPALHFILPCPLFLGRKDGKRMPLLLTPPVTRGMIKERNVFENEFATPVPVYW